MTHKKEKKNSPSPDHSQRSEKTQYDNPNDAYFGSHFEELVDNYGGKWIVMAEGEVVAICEGHEMPHYADQIRKRGITPFAAPIPRPEEIECLL